MKYYTSWGKSLEHVILNEKKGRQPRRRPPSPAVARRRY